MDLLHNDFNRFYQLEYMSGNHYIILETLEEDEAIFRPNEVNSIKTITHFEQLMNEPLFLLRSFSRS